jgi:hypothetical protein
VPWPATFWNRTEPGYDHAEVAAALRRPPRLVELDPRHLWASQPRVTRAGVEYYLNDTGYPRLGVTYADREQLANRFPLIYRRRGGRLVILGGHHRSAAALLAGRNVLVLLTSAPMDSTTAQPGESSADARPSLDAAAVTPTLHLGTQAGFPHEVVETSHDATAAIEGGGCVLVACAEVALTTLIALGGERAAAEQRVRRAEVGLATG